jgi:hypothetical protein
MERSRALVWLAKLPNEDVSASPRATNGTKTKIPARKKNRFTE